MPGRMGCKVRVSRFGWGAGPLGVVPWWKAGFCGSKGSWEKDETLTGVPGQAAPGYGVSSLLFGLHRKDWRDSG